MGFFNNIFKPKASQCPEGAVFLPQDIAQLLRGSSAGAGLAINTSTLSGQTTAYESCAVVRSVINKKAQATAMFRAYVKDGADNEIARPREFAAFLQPNPYQSVAELVTNIVVYTQVYGKAYVVRLHPQGLPIQLYAIPNAFITPQPSMSARIDFRPELNIEQYYIAIDGMESLAIPAEDVFVIHDTGGSLSTYGESVSRLNALPYQVNILQSSYEASNELLVNRGMLGIISLMAPNASAIQNSAVPQLKNERDDVQEALRRYGIMRRQAKFAVTPLDAKYVPVSSSIKDLNLNEQQQTAKREIAYAYGVPAILLDIEGGTYANVSEAKVDFYTSTIQPEADNIFAVLNRAHGFEEFKIKPYYDHLEPFQEAKRSQAAGMVSAVTALTTAMQSGLMSAGDAKKLLDKYITEG